MSDQRWFSVASSLARVAVLVAVVGTAFIRLDSSAFVRFSQFHVGLSLASFLECLAVIERNRLYLAGTAGISERRSLRTCGVWAGPVLLALGLALLWYSSLAASIAIGAGIAAMTIPESIAVRQKPLAAAKREVAALLGMATVVAGSWVMPVLHERFAMCLLAAAACAPRLATLGLSDLGPGSVGWRPGLQCIGRARKRLLPFVGYQATLPWLLTVPNYAIPTMLPPREASWLLLAIRASGTVASMLQRILLERWLQLVDGRARRIGTRGVVICLLTLSLSTLGMVWWAPEIWQVLGFAATLAMACACLAYISTAMNARNRFLQQLPAYALFWVTGSVVSWLMFRHSGAITVGTIVAMQTAGAMLGLAVIAASSRR